MYIYVLTTYTVDPAICTNSFLQPCCVETVLMPVSTGDALLLVTYHRHTALLAHIDAMMSWSAPLSHPVWRVVVSLSVVGSACVDGFSISPAATAPSRRRCPTGKPSG